MKIKRIILLSILVLSVVSTIGVMALGKDPFPVIFLGLFCFFLIYALWASPPKHKDFWLYPSFSKRKMAGNRAYSGIEVHLGCAEFTGNLNTHSWVVRVCG
jgi:hypothetical protein